MKKLKLVMSIATMCLALAVLCFGVFSATNITYTIGGSISYEVNDVFATVETDVYTSSFNNATNLKAEAEKFLTSSNVENAVQTDYKYDFTTKGLDSENYSNITKMDGNTEGGINIEYNTTDKRTYFIVVSVTNNGDNIISAKSNTLDLKSANTQTQSINKISSLAKGETGKIVFALMLDDITKSIDAGVSFEYIITLQNGEIAGPVATFSYLNYDNEFIVDETKTQVLTEQIFTDSNFELDGDHFDTRGYLYNFHLSDIDISKFNNVQITFSTSNSFPIFIAPKCYANFEQFAGDAASSVMGQDTASAYYDLTEATPLKFCIFILTDGETAPISGYNLKISISKSFTEGEFRYFAINKDTAWLVGPKDENITGNNGEITIPKTFQDPETFQDKPVVGLQPAIGLFGNCNNIKKVIIQDNIKEIPMRCFESCSTIQEIVLGSGIELIGGGAFYLCNNLTTVTFETGSKLTSIGDYAFYYCTCLTSIEIPSSVTSIGDYAFEECSDLTNVIFETGSQLTSIGDRAFYGCSGLTSINIPSSVTSIGSQAFSSCRSLTSITIPSGVTSIGSNAFWNCSSLTSITIPSSVTSIGDQAFASTQWLANLKADSNGLKIVTSSDNANVKFLFGYTGSLATITEDMLSGVQVIYDRAFYNNKTLQSINIPSSVTNIGKGAFYGCSGLTSIEIPSSVTSIGTDAFYKCSGLESITVSGTGGTYTAQGNCLIKGTELVAGCKTSVIPTDGSVTSIGDYAFNGCSGLTSINIPSRVTSIGNYAFDGCSGLTSIQIPNSVISIGESAFYECSSLTSINIPSSLTSIGTNAFCGCSSLTSIEIPSSVTSIGESAFSGCSGLTSITIPSSVTSIGTWAFERCIGLTSVTFEEGSKLTSIGDRAFDGCSGLTSITIPSSVTSIGESAFSSCSGLTTINFTGTQAQWNAISKSSANIKAGVNVVCTDGTIVTA